MRARPVLASVLVLLLAACGKAPEADREAAAGATAPLTQAQVHEALPSTAPSSLPVATDSTAAGSLTVEGTAFVLSTPEGQVLRGTQLVGAVVHLAMGGGEVAPLRIASIAIDPENPEILRHDFEVPDGKGDWMPACQPNAYGERWGFPIALPVGHPGREGAITITCTNGAVAKCVRFGYPTWSKGPKGEDLVPLHAACVRMVRADYCGDGKAHTKERTTIDNYDDSGIETRGLPNDRAFVFEAGWTPEGAICVAHVRWADLATLEGLKAQCPRIAKMAVCDEASARAAGARMFNTSKIQ